MNKPEIETTKALFKEFPTKHIDSVPSIKSWELNEIKIIQTNRKDNPKLSSQNSEEIIELNHMSPNSKLRKSENPSTASLEGKISHKKTKEYTQFAIPPNWDLARKHANSRKATREFEDDEAAPDVKDEICPCCGYEVNRKEIGLCESSSKLNFLGAGYPLIFNYYLYCIIVLLVLFLSFGVYALYSNRNGHFCHEEKPHVVEGATGENNSTALLRYRYLTTTEATETTNSTENANPTENSTENSTEIEKEGTTEEEACILDWITVISLANKLDNPEAEQIQSSFAIVAEILIIMVLMYFRKHQRQINNLVDEQTNTPADYTIMVDGIPTGLKDCDYITELKQIFGSDNKNGKTYGVEKINLVYNTKEIEEIEKEIKKVVEKKKNTLRKNGFDTKSKEVDKIEEEFEGLEHKLAKLRVQMTKSNDKFAGIAFISFSTEDEKQEFVEKQQVSSIERMKLYLSHKKERDPADERIYFHDKLLYIEEAPEPNDVNWEFIYASTKDKIKIRIFLNILFVFLLGGCFGVIWVITYFQSKTVEHAYESKKEGLPGADEEFNRAKSISIVISAIIVCFNKFCLGRIVHILTDHEKYSNFTKLNISFGSKLSLALFFNTALITLFVEMITFENYYGYGGMISTEHTIFILNAFLPPFVWFFDPWFVLKYIEKKLIMRKVSQTNNKLAITQEEANELMEEVPYNMAKRYAEIMKTMWFTFFYAPAIPIGIVWSAVGILFYYWVDKYNLIRRRTVKENISMNLTINMIELLELSLIFFGFSCVLLDKQLYGEVSIQSYFVLIIGILHSVLPMETVNEKLFPLKSQNETANYRESVLDFDTDYDRENPVTKVESIKSWAKLRISRSIVKTKQLSQKSKEDE